MKRRQLAQNGAAPAIGELPFSSETAPAVSPIGARAAPAADLHRPGTPEAAAAVSAARHLPVVEDHPRTVADCRPGTPMWGQRPCPFEGCSAHLGDGSCTVDIAEETARTGQPPTYEAIGAKLGISGERARQLEAEAIAKVRRALGR